MKPPPMTTTGRASAAQRRIAAAIAAESAIERRLSTSPSDAPGTGSVRGRDPVASASLP